MVLPLLKLTEIDPKKLRIRGRDGDHITANNSALPNSLHRLRAGTNPERAAFMEENSLLTSRSLGVSSEQVSIFLTSDNTLISFFESSGNDVETPLITRLSSRDTILRHSCDASMLCQALLDAIIDLSFPVIHAYQDAIGDLEVEVLTSPGIHHTRSLYVITREIAAMRSAISPIIGLINTLRDHGPAASVSPAILQHYMQANPLRYGAQPPPYYAAADGGAGARSMSSVAISPLATTYLTDVLDHCFLITDALDQMRHTSDGLIGLIFNTIGTRQNESMRQLTFVSIIFLPMSFLTGYFGMNFETFPSIQHSEWFFWGVAIPVATMTVLLLMRRTIIHQIRAKTKMFNILQSRRKRLRAVQSEPGVNKTD
jgi:Mg2+ and Co2+ transporter CorA